MVPEELSLAAHSGKQLINIPVLAILPSLSHSPHSLTSASWNHLPDRLLHPCPSLTFCFEGDPTKIALITDVSWRVNGSGLGRVEPCLYKPVQLIYRHLF